MNLNNNQEMKAEAKKSKDSNDLDMLSVNTIRFLSVDAIQKANSGHPGLPMGAAAMAYILWTRCMKYNPKDPHWFNRDRFVLSAGHGSMLLYSMLYLTGYDLPLEQIKQFRQWGSSTPGHPERGETPGVEVTTGPLGQGFGNGVGMALAEANLAARYNKPGYPIIDHFTYAIVSDGDLMEGASSEAASYAGNLKLHKLIYLYDDNHITLSASTDLTFTEDVGMRFKAYGWHVQTISDGNDLAALEDALQNAREELGRPSLIITRTHIGYGSPNKQDTYEAHGSPLGEKEVKLTKENLGWPLEPAFYVPEEVLSHYRKAIARGQQDEKDWDQLFSAYSEDYPELAEELHQIMLGELPEGWDADLPEFSPSEKGIATRVASGKVMNAFSTKLPAFIGGSADLNPSTYTALEDEGDFLNPQETIYDDQGMVGGGWNYSGINLHFGVREHAMGAILNGLAAHGGMIPFGSTFLIFSDYMRPPMRLAALMNLHVIYVFTHDSIAVGEDGPTHEPIEQLIGLRAIPNMLVIRPADANETTAAWRIAIEHTGPVALILTRQKIPILDLKQYSQLPLGVKAGGYVLADAPDNHTADISLIASGSEVHLALDAREKLEKQDVNARVISLPSWNLFDTQPEEYRNAVLPPDVPMLAIEAGSSLGWRTYVGSGVPVIAIDHFGASAPGELLMQKFGFNVEHVVEKALQVVKMHK